MITETTTSEATETCIANCNKMLRGERAAVETYNQVIEKYGADTRISKLHSIRDEHRDSVKLLEQNVIGMGGTPDMESGPWGTFAAMVTGAAKFFGKESAVEALMKGEEKGLSDYESLVEDNDELMPGCRDMYRTTLIPRTKNHIAVLDTIEETID